VRKQSHDPLHEVKLVVEADSLEVLEECGHVEGHQAGCQQRSVLEVEVVRVFFDEGPQVGQIDLLQKRQDQTLLRRPLKLGEKHDSHRV